MLLLICNVYGKFFAFNWIEKNDHVDGLGKVLQPL